MSLRFYSMMICLSIATFTYAQTPISGTPNSYAIVLGKVDDGCRSYLRLNQTTGFEVGKDALLVQMKGATIQEGNSDDFGEIIDLGSTGRFERVTITEITNERAYLSATPLYNYDFTSPVQLVSIATYEEAEVVDTLRPQPWNGSTGGVLALEVTGTLSLKAPIIATDLGFKGGLAESIGGNDCNFLINQNDFFYPEGSWRGAMKGEGIAESIISKEWGKGPQATGGGGANDHNAGGGGGANASRGGSGGQNKGSSTFGCKGNHPGLGGRFPLEQDRILLGGGGGAGHGNNNLATHGGHGGGIILLLAEKLINTGGKIEAKGQSGGQTSGDGAGGGGAGGTVVLQIGALENALSIDVKGGDGGNIVNSGGLCMGPGGGGSGGKLLWDQSATSNGNLAQVVLAEGVNGQSENCNDSPNGATSGAEGVWGSFDGLPQNTPSNTGGITILSQPEEVNICVGAAAQFELEVSGTGQTYQWQVLEGGNWVDLLNNAIYSGVQSPVLMISSVPLALENARYRCLVRTACEEVESKDAGFLFSTPLEILQEAVLPTMICVGDNMALVIDVAGQGLTYQWEQIINGQFVGLPESTPFSGTSSNRLEITAVPDGQLSFRCLVKDICGTSLYSETVSFEATAVPVAQFQFTINGKTVDFSSLNIDGDYRWTFGDGTLSSEVNPTHTYSTGGTYPVRLTITNECGTATFEVDVIISSITQPNAQFTVEQSGGCAPFKIVFSDQSGPQIDRWNWSFPGGTPATSTDSMPEVVYEEAGIYDVQLEVQNAIGTSRLEREAFIEVLERPRANFSFEVDGRVVRFTNLSEGTDDFIWNFDDGSPVSMERDPVHEFTRNGDFMVSLSAINPYCSSIIGEAVQIFVVSISEVDQRLALYPNPTRGNCQLEGEGLDLLEIKLYDGLGRLLERRPIETGNDPVSIDLSARQLGIYYLQIETKEGPIIKKIVKVE